jgi:hypothetical protein
MPNTPFGPTPSTRPPAPTAADDVLAEIQRLQHLPVGRAMAFRELLGVLAIVELRRVVDYYVGPAR